MSALQGLFQTAVSGELCKLNTHKAVFTHIYLTLITTCKVLSLLMLIKPSQMEGSKSGTFINNLFRSLIEGTVNPEYKSNSSILNTK